MPGTPPGSPPGMPGTPPGSPPGMPGTPPGSPPGIPPPRPPDDKALLAGINRSPAPGMTLFISPLSEPKSELAMFTASPAPPMPPTPGTGSGSSARNGCCGAAEAMPAPTAKVAIAASAAPMPTFTLVIGRRAVGFAKMFSDNGIPSDSDDSHTVHQTLQSLWTLCCSNVTGTTRHDHRQDSIGSLSNLGVCLLRPPRYQPRLFLARNWGADLRRRPRHDPPLGLTPSRRGQLTVVR